MWLDGSDTSPVFQAEEEVEEHAVGEEKFKTHLDAKPNGEAVTSCDSDILKV